MNHVMSHPHGAAGAYRAPLISLVSASGGVGKSTLALVLAHVAARSVIKTALVEADLQFGDMGFWLGIDTASPSLALGTECTPIPISHHLDLFKAPPLPEVAEDVSDAAASLVAEIRKDYALVIADTGQFWSGLTGELLCTSDLVLILMDQRKASVYGAAKALELCRRINVPSARIACVINRVNGKPRGELKRVQDTLNCGDLFQIAEGKSQVDALISSSRIEELVEGECATILDAQKLLETILPRMGIEYESNHSRRTRRLFL